MAMIRPTVDGALLDNANASYDKAAKRFLSKKKLLAWILKYCVAEFRDYSIKDIAEKYIEGDPTASIETIPVDSDLTNAAQPENIKGSRNEDGTTTEGTAVFDIMFRAVVPTTGERITLIINIEPQKTVHVGYKLIRRGIFYACRMISAQKETEFHGDDFDGIKKVYSIWIVMDALFRSANSIRCYSIQEKILHGHGREALKDYDLMTVVMVFLGKGTTKHRLLKLLHLIFLDELKAAEKKTILKRDYDITLTPTMEKELSEMGSLAEGIAERAAAKAAAKAKEEERKGMMTAIKMIKENTPFDAIVKKTGMTIAALTELKAML